MVSSTRAVLSRKSNSVSCSASTDALDVFLLLDTVVSPFVSFHSIIAVGSPSGVAILTGSAGSSNVDASEGAPAVV